MADVRITPIQTEDGLYCHYDGQRQPQPCVLSLDLETGELTAQYNPEVDTGARPLSVFNGRVLWVAIPTLTGTAANRLLEEAAPLAQQILENSTIEWDGSNHIGVLYPDGRAALDELTDRCDPQGDQWDDADTVSTWDARDWFAQESADQTVARLGITAETSDDQIGALAVDEQAEALNGCPAGRVHLAGVEGHLRQLRDEMAGLT